VPLRRASAVEPSEQNLLGRERTPRIAVSASLASDAALGSRRRGAPRVVRDASSRAKSRDDARDNDSRRREHA
jgi:hypothetical protein